MEATEPLNKRARTQSLSEARVAIKRRFAVEPDLKAVKLSKKHFANLPDSETHLRDGTVLVHAAPQGLQRRVWNDGLNQVRSAYKRAKPSV